MTSKRNLAILAAVLVVLVGISVAQKLGHRRTTSRAATAVLVEGAYTADAVGRIELGRGAEQRAVVLAAAPDGWRVETSWNARASRERIDALLSTLSDLTGEYRSGSREVLADYGLDDAGAVTIRVFGRDGQPLFGLDVGGRPGGGAGNFVRRPGDDEVYLAAAGVLAQLGIYGEPSLPAGKPKKDDAFGEVEIDRGELAFSVPITAGQPPFTLQLTSQGCADIGICYPPQTHTLPIALTSGILYLFFWRWMLRVQEHYADLRAT